MKPELTPEERELLKNKDKESEAEAQEYLQATAPGPIKDMLLGIVARAAQGKPPASPTLGNKPRRRGRVENVPALFLEDDMEARPPVVLVPNQVTRAVPAFNQQVAEWQAGNLLIPGWLFYGDYGRGKSSVAIEIMRYAAKHHGQRCRYEKAQAILGRVKETYSEDIRTTEREVINKYTEYNILTVDEVGAQYATEAERNIITWIFVARYEAMRPTIFTSNLDPTTPEGRARLTACLGERVIARLKGWTIDAGQWGGNLRDRSTP